MPPASAASRKSDDGVRYVEESEADGDFSYKVNDRVQHSKWGEGVIKATNGRGPSMMVTVKFDGGPTKTLMAEYAKLEKVVQLRDV